MTFLLLSMVLVAATISVVRPAMSGVGPVPLVGLTGTHLIIVMSALVALALSFGVAASLSILLAHVVHEAGLVLGHRLAGHTEARFRLLPMPRSGPVSRAPHGTDLEVAFVTLMGPALGLAPMVLAFALSDFFVGGPLHHAFGTLALGLGAFNFVALLPIWPLAGGRLMQLFLRRRFPSIGPMTAAFLLAGLVAFSWAAKAPILFLICVVGALAYTLQPALPDTRPALSAPDLSRAVAAYLALLCAFFLGGWWVILLVTGQF